MEAAEWTNSAWIASPNDQKAASIRYRYHQLSSDTSSDTSSDIRTCGFRYIRSQAAHSQITQAAEKKRSSAAVFEVWHFRAPCAAQ